MPDLTIRGGRILDPANDIDATHDIVIVDGHIAAPDTEAKGETIAATGLIIAPGLIDIHTHLREPGFEHKETIETGAQAAARGGFTTVCAMPNTEPPTDSAGAVEFIMRRALETAIVRVLPIACISKGRKGEELAELAELAAAGAVAFSDDGAPVADPALMRRAIEYAGMLRTPVINHCEDRALSAGGVMHEGWVSARLGLMGVPSSAEEAMVARDIALAEAADRPVHLAHLSTFGSVELVRQGKARGIRVTAEVTPHHLALNHEAVIGGGETPGGLAYDANAKVNPPLRSQEDTDACLAGLLDGTIDCIATDHAPHAIQDKQCEFDEADFGISSLETALALTLTRVPIENTVRALTIGPAQALGLHNHIRGIGTLSPGAPGDVVLIDPEAEWTVDPAVFASKGKNTPLGGVKLKGRVVATVVSGKVILERMTSYRTIDTWLGEKCDTLADILEPALTCVFVGLNPSVVSVEKGHYLQGTLGRQFWGLLHAYDILPRPENSTFPDETLLGHGFGITDLVKRPSPRANELTGEDIATGAAILRRKIERYQPQFVCSIYKSTLEALTGKKYSKQYGLLDETIGQTRLFAAPFPYRSRDEVATHFPQLHKLLAKAKNGQ